MIRLFVAMEDALLLVTRQQERWQLDLKLDGLPTYCVAADPHRPTRVYCSTFGQGLWRSNDAGDMWEPVGEGIAYGEVMSVAVSPIERVGDFGVVLSSCASLAFSSAMRFTCCARFSTISFGARGRRWSVISPPLAPSSVSILVL